MPGGSSVLGIATRASDGLRLGIAHHYGWAVAVTATADHEVVDRRRLELLGQGLPAAPIHHEGGTQEMHRTGPPLDDEDLAARVAEVRASAATTTAASLEDLAAVLRRPITSISLRAWPADFPTDIAIQRRVPHESRADSVMYRQVLADLAAERGWAVHHFDGRTVEADARAFLGNRADEVLLGPRARLGAPWSKDHRIALAATVTI